MAKFFISYSRSVKEEVGNVVALLRASEHEVWWDGDIPIVADWWATILKHIEWCEIFIFVASEKSVKSAYCIAELKYANERNRPILPFIIDDATTYTLPNELPHRNQWLVYDGNPAHMLAAINNAIQHIEWEKHRDLPAPRPPEPLTDGKSLSQQFQEARRLANDEEFEEAKKLFRNIKDLDYGEWGSECDEWLARLNSYAHIVELADDESTLKRARATWDKHSRLYGKDFDPHGIEAILKKQKSSAKRLITPAMVGVVTVVSIAAIAATIIALSGNNPPSVTLEPLSTTAVALVDTEVPTDEPTSTSTVTDEPTPIDRSTQTPADTLTPTIEPTRTVGLTRTPLGTVEANGTIAIVNVETANLRSGPGTNYNRVGSVSSGTSFPVIARTADSEWYLIELEDGKRAWIWAGIVSVTNLDSQSIQIVVTIPPLPSTTGNTENETNASAGLPAGLYSCNAPETRLRVGGIATVVEGFANTIWGANWESLKVAGSGEILQVIEGPFCQRNPYTARSIFYVYYQVLYEDIIGYAYEYSYEDDRVHSYILRP